MTFTIVGLGNPGRKYNNTRHNIGARAVRALQEELDFPDWQESEKLQAKTTRDVIDFNDVVLLLPTTFMNKSGISVEAAVPTERNREGLIVVHDDIDLPLGSVRVSHDKSAGGHNGVRSIIEALGSQEFTRVRIGITSTDEEGNISKPDQSTVKDYVLGTFRPEEREMLGDQVLPKTINAIITLIEEGRGEAMNKINQ